MKSFRMTDKSLEVLLLLLLLLLLLTKPERRSSIGVVQRDD